MSRIALNARLLVSNKLEGTGRFTHQCFKRLVVSRPNDQFLLLFDRKPSKEFKYGENVEVVTLFPPARRPWLFDIWFDYSVTKKIRTWNADVFVSTDGYISRRTSIPQLNVIHDINFEHNPQWLPTRYAKHFRSRFPQYAKLANKLCTVSEYSKNDIAMCYNLDSKNISVIPNAPDEIFQPLDSLRQQLARDEFTNGKPYIIYVGSLHPRKNIPGMINAFKKYRTFGGKCELLVVGVSMWRDEKQDAPNVHYVGRLNDRHLANAVAGADAMLYLPFFEGFGVPILEAMASGVPVVASSCTSIPEVCGDAAANLVDPIDDVGAAKALLRLEKDLDWKQTKISAGICRAQDFSWDTSASLLSNSIDELLNV